MKRFISLAILLAACGLYGAVGDAVVTYKTNLVVAQTNLSATVSNLTVYGALSATGTFLNTNQFTGNSTIKSGALLTNVQSYTSLNIYGTGLVSAAYVNSTTPLLKINGTTGGSVVSMSVGDVINGNMRVDSAGNMVVNCTTGKLFLNLDAASSQGVDVRGPLGFSSDTFLVREAANSLALRNSTNAQSLYIYNKYNSASDYERFNIGWGGDTLVLRSQAVGSGSQRQVVMDGSALYFQITALARWVIDTSKLYPYADGAYDIGSTANNVKTLYVSNIVAKGSVTMNALTVTNNSSIGGTNYISELVVTNGVTINGYRKTSWGAVPITRGGTTNLGPTHSTFLVVTNNSVITLPTAVGIEGRAYTIKAIDPATTVTITNSTGAQTIDGALAWSLTASNKHVTVQSDNANWWIIGGN